MEAIEKRRSIRKYIPEIPEKSIIDEILRAAVLAPSAKNRQPWKFLVYTNKSKDKLLNAMEAGLTRMRDSSDIPPEAGKGLPDAFHTMKIMQEAPVVIMVLNTNAGSPFLGIDADARITEICDTLSVGAAVENMLLKATELGLGTLWIANTCYAYPELTAFLGTSAQLTGAVALGYANESPALRPRKPWEEVVEYFDE